MKKNRCHLCMETSAHHGPAKLGVGTALLPPTPAAAGAELVPEDMIQCPSSQLQWPAVHPSIHLSVCVPERLVRSGRSLGISDLPGLCVGGYLSPDLFHRLSLL